MGRNNEDFNTGRSHGDPNWPHPDDIPDYDAEEDWFGAGELDKKVK